MRFRDALALIYTLMMPVVIITLIWLASTVGMTTMEGLGIGAIIGQMMALLVLVFQFYYRKRGTDDKPNR
mgnify:CR=1 FL=1